MHDVVAIVGPTASGKSALAMALSATIPCEIISVDSALIYRGMDIGTAKPSLAERAAVPHHLIDIVEPTERYSVAQFYSDVAKIVPDVIARKRLPILVGGTMMYFNALQKGLSQLPPSDATLRAVLTEDMVKHGVVAMHARLAKIDPATANRLASTDTQRIQRALEIITLTGEPLSVLLARERAFSPLFNMHLFSLEPQDRSLLHARIVTRLDKMLAAGFLEEVKALYKRGDITHDLPAMRAVGYREAYAYLSGQYDLETFRDRTIIATRQLAKRQLTWLRAMSKRIVLNCFEDNICTLVQQHIAKWHKI